jgi:hypothetical protein
LDLLSDSFGVVDGQGERESEENMLPKNTTPSDSDEVREDEAYAAAPATLPAGIYR